MKARHFDAFCFLFFCCAAIVGAAFYVAGCSASATAGGDAKTYWIEALPDWRAPANPAPVTAAAVTGEVASLAPGAALLTSDARFTAINHAFALDVIAWTRSFLAITRRGYVAESFDCDKFAKAFTLAVEMSAGRAGVTAQPLAARIYVHQRAAFGGVPAAAPPNDGHALVGLYTDAGPIVVEPQSGTWCPLAAYPNRAEIWRVSIGG